MYPFGGLPENLVAFCAYLRREHGFLAGPGEARDAARALELLDVADERAVRDALRPILSRRWQDAAIFDRAFDAFFFPGPEGVQQHGLPPAAQRIPSSDEERPSPERPGPAGEGHEDDRAGEGGMPIPAPGAGEAGPERLSLARVSYSATESAGAAADLAPVDEAWRDAARMLVRRVQLGRSRRWRPSPRGRRFDVRRTMRAGIQTAGEMLSVKWLRRPRRSPRFVVLVDGSRSMTEHALTALGIAVALAGVTMRVEAFTFSTRIERVTRPVRRAASGRRARLEGLGRAWGGGTSIGGSLAEFLRRFGERMLGPDTLVIIASDGLDLGEPDRLRDAVRELRRKSAAVVWVNPLLETPGYEPTARGMAAARPFVTLFASANDAPGFRALARAVRV
jgi:uncharacterized protein with von Willebrand factor type A (vWA) domain